jgi:cytochrome P450 family 135
VSKRKAAPRDGLPPGPRQPALLQLLRWVHRPDPFLRLCHERYGDQFTLRLAGVGPSGFNDVVFLVDPETIGRVFSGGPSLSRVGYARQPLQAMFGPKSVLVIDGDSHLRQRKLLLPPFHGNRLGAYADAISKITEREVAAWPLGRGFPIQERMQAITLEVILRVVFGLDDPGRRAIISEHVKRMLELVAHPLAELLMGFPGRIGPLNIRAGVERTIAEADRELLAEIGRRRADPGLHERDDVLSLLLQATDEKGEGMADTELRDELVTLLLAGHETTATAIAWTFEHLFRNPEAHDRLTAECRQNDHDGPYLDAVIKEVLRLRPPLPICDRVLEESFDVGRFQLPAGTIIAPCIYLVHRRADLYPQPDEFRPERFLDSEVENYAWLPFGGGMRRCLGASFALLEMKIVLSLILRRATLRPATEDPERMGRRAIVLAPKNGVPAVLVDRVQAAVLPR